MEKTKERMLIPRKTMLELQKEIELKFAFKDLVIILALFAQCTFANSSFMIGAKTFTLDFKGYSGFMLELGGSVGIPINNEKLFWGVHSGFGYSGDSRSEQITSKDKITLKYSSIGLPIKTFFSYGLFGVNIGALITFWDIKVSENVTGSNISDLSDKGTKTFFDFGLMIFPAEQVSIGLDVITGKTTGFALGVAYHFGKRTHNYYDNADYNDADYDDAARDDCIYNALIELERKDEYDSVYICLELNNGKINCLNLSERFEFKDKSLDDINDFEKKTSFLQWNKMPVSIPYTEFFPDGLCD
ncbi:MAG: porin family protein [Fibromonadales bacterium]|nr:porin family protein [Fibromonadales bacterium]